MYHYYSLLHQNNELCPCNNEFIFTYYNLLLHVIAYCCISAANTMCDVLTGPRSSTPDILDTPDDDVLEPYQAIPKALWCS